MFIVAILIQGLVETAFVAGGIYLLMNNHPVAGGWLIAGAILALLGTQVSYKNKKDNKEENN
ncbi:MAG: hypothetical protein LBD41_06855 [Clostridiales Family XIII bacterium]|jgi:hypothetical protein|nr:hypothetical protein [Clostridiales Family XIII bacterium]